MIVIGGSDVYRLLSMKSCIRLMEEVFKAYASGEVVQPLRTVVPLGDGNVMGLMPSFYTDKSFVAVKTITIFPGNHERNLDSHLGVISLFDGDTGVLLATIDATSVTAIRTAAVSGVATAALANPGAETLAMIGTGLQARTHLSAMMEARPIRRVRVYGRNHEKAEAYVAEMREEMRAKYGLNRGIEIDLCETVEAAVHDADIICTVTASTTPIVEREWVKAGAHVNAVGSSQPAFRELSSALVRDAEFYVDSVQSALSESGDFLIPMREGLFDESHIVGDLGSRLLSRIPGRRSASSITVFKSLGLAVEDLAAAAYVYREAERLGVGVAVEL